MTHTANRAIRELRALRFAQHSELFEAGRLADATSDKSLVLRVNTIVASQHPNAEGNTPADLANAISVNGDVHNHAELVAFGRWLLLDGRPGMKPQGGKQPDPRVILKCVAASICELRLRPRLRKHNMKTSGRAHRNSDITKHDVATRWSHLFNETVKPSAFDARLRV